MKSFTKTLSMLLIGMFLMLPAVFAAGQDQTPIRIKGVVRYVASFDMYGILSDDGKKYQPTKQLPRGFQTDGLEVVVEGNIRDDLIGARMWGKAFTVTRITRTSKYISPEDKEAIKLLLDRMDAFNNKNLAKLQKIDVVARGLTQQQFDEWLGVNNVYKLNYVEAAISGPLGSSEINGICLYSREIVNGISLFNNTSYTLARFTINKIDDGWKFTDISSYNPEGNRDDVIADLLTKSKEKYGNTDLAQWKGK
jgi:hypothetical protein